MSMRSQRSRGGVLPPVIAAVLLLALCAVTVRSGSREITLSLDGRTGHFPFSPTGIMGEDVEVYRSSDAVGGRIGFREIELDLLPTHISGTYGGKPVELDLKLNELGGLEVDGTYGERTVGLVASQTRIAGLAGGCSYWLSLGGGRYAGFRDCNDGRRPVPVSLQLPERLGEETDPEVAATLFLTLVPEGLAARVPASAAAASARAAPPRRPR